MYYSAIGLLAGLVLCIVNWDILRHSQAFDKPAWNIYRRFLFAVLAYYVTDILWGILEYKKLSTALFVDTTIYFMAMAAGISFWADYIIAYLDQKSTFGRVLVNTGRVIAGVVFGVTLINLFKPVLFTVDSSSVYTALPLRYVMLVSQILFLILLSVCALTAMKRSGVRADERRRFRIPASFGIIMALCLFIQLWFPYLPLYSIAYMLGTCLLHAFVANDEKAAYKEELAEAEKIAELKDRFRALLDNLPCMAFTKDAETGIYLTCNQAFADYAHKDSPEGVIGLTNAEIFDAESTAQFIRADKIALSLSKPYIYYEDVTDAEGNPRQLQTTKLRYKDTQGRACILGMCQDITDLVSIQHEHAMTREAYESAVNTGLMYNHIAQTLARDYTEMFYVNTDTEEFTEYRRGEEDGTLSEIRKGWHFFSDCKAELSESAFPEDKEAFLTAMNRKKLMKALECKDTFVMSYRRIVRNKPVYFSMKVSRMENDAQYIIVGFMDVDAEMHEAIAKNEALSDALSSAEAANHAMTAFLSDMSHEIRTPINAIIRLDTLALKQKDLDEKTRDYFEKIGDSAQHLLSMINEILEMNRFETGKETLSQNEFSLSTVLEQINIPIMAQCSKKGLLYEYNLLDQADHAYIGDEKKLRKVLTNLLSNVISITEAPATITMTVEKTIEHDEKATLRFCIRDTGIVIEQKLLPELFAGDNTGSNGLGMTLTKKSVEMMNGFINVRSEKGYGTEFTVLLPFDKAARKDMAQTGEIDPHALHILVVDDNPIEAEHARMVLEEAGIRAEACTSGQEALRKIEVQHVRQQPYSMVLMDWNMPGMNGRETSAEILRQYDKESIVVAMTAYNWDDIQEAAHQAGVDDYLEKPLFAANVIENLERIAQRNHLAIFKEKKKARLAGRRILLAEDNELNAEILTDMLDMENIKVDHAENGKIAVALFDQSTAGIYSAILMDVRMPLMDGLEAAKAIRSLNREDAKRIPIIALTANAFDEDVQLSMQVGMNAHLNKPVEADHLLRTLGELIYEAEQTLTF
ncbi:MAG: response regulator [Oscillospiraceae bacterium]|nr:response regulator [Oscillospiraceae bacterium]